MLMLTDSTASSEFLRDSGKGTLGCRVSGKGTTAYSCIRCRALRFVMVKKSVLLLGQDVAPRLRDAQLEH